MKRIAVICVLALVGYTKLILQSGFDQGADVAICLVASVQQGGKPVTLAVDSPACIAAGKYKRTNPLWLLLADRSARP